MRLRVRKEEYSALGDFIKTSFVRDQATITQRFPKLNSEFLTLFSEKLEAIKVLESRLVLTHEQKSLTASLYSEARVLKKELNFLNSYITLAGLNTSLVSDLKGELAKVNIEGAVSKIESVKQFINEYSSVLVEEGMSEDFATTLDSHKTSLTGKNAQQNQFMNVTKLITENNNSAYTELYDLIVKIADAGKLVFDGTVTEDEYTITKIITRMRGPKHKQPEPVNN